MLERFREFKELEKITGDEALRLDDEKINRWQELLEEFTDTCNDCDGSGCVTCDDKGYTYDSGLLMEVIGAIPGVYAYFIYHDDDYGFLIVDGSSDVAKIEEVFGTSLDEVMNQIHGGTNGWEMWGYRDEYTQCDECGALIRTQPDSYSWKADFSIVNECEMLCGDCIRKEPTGYVNELINNSHKANTILSTKQLEECGFSRINADFSNGYYGREDSPHKIMEKLQEAGYDEVIFNIDSVGQFETNFEAWVRTVEGCLVKVVNYFDVWGNEEEGYEVNNWDTFKEELWLRDTEHDTIIERLKELNFLTEEASLENIEVWDDGEMIEFFVKETMCPMFRVEVIVNDVQEPVEDVEDEIIF